MNFDNLRQFIETQAPRLMEWFSTDKIIFSVAAGVAVGVLLFLLFAKAVAKLLKILIAAVIVAALLYYALFQLASAAPVVVSLLP